MNASENENSDLEAKAKNIDVLYKSTLFKIQELGDRAFAILKSIRLKREAKKVQDLRNDLLN